MSISVVSRDMASSGTCWYGENVCRVEAVILLQDIENKHESSHTPEPLVLDRHWRIRPT